MNEEVFNLGIRKLLKRFGVTAQREVEKAVDEAIKAGILRGSETLKAHAILTIDGLPMRMVLDDEIPLA
jgi:hypothetical protein